MITFSPNFYYFIFSMPRSCFLQMWGVKSFSNILCFTTEIFLTTELAMQVLNLRFEI